MTVDLNDGNLCCEILCRVKVASSKLSIQKFGIFAVVDVMV